MSDNNNEGFTFQEQQELLDIKNRYFTLKEKHNNLKALVEITKRESTRLIGKASIIFWLSFFALGVMIGIEYPDFVDSGWFILYFIGGIALFIVTILLCSREHDNYATEEREVYQQMCKAKREYEKIQHRISDSSLIPPKNQETSKTTSEKKEPSKQYVRTYPPPKPVQPPQKPISPPKSEPPPRPSSPYQSIRRDLSSNSNTNSSQIEYSKHRDALITKIHDSGMANYRLYGHPYEFLGFPDNPFVTQDYYPIGLPGQPLKYMVYTSNDGSIYHKRCGCSGASNRLSVFQAFDKNMIPCRICCNCNHNEEYPTWLYSVHDLYLNLVNECFKYDICIQRNDNKQLEFDIDIMEFARLRLIVL